MISKIENTKAKIETSKKKKVVELFFFYWVFIFVGKFQNLSTIFLQSGWFLHAQCWHWSYSCNYQFGKEFRKAKMDILSNQNNVHNLGKQCIQFLLVCWEESKHLLSVSENEKRMKKKRKKKLFFTCHGSWDELMKKMFVPWTFLFKKNVKKKK